MYLNTSIQVAKFNVPLHYCPLLKCPIQLDQNTFTIDLSEDEVRAKMCDDIFNYLEMNLIKYKDRFQDFDAIGFIPLLKERIDGIKRKQF